jgi:integrase
MTLFELIIRFEDEMSGQWSSSRRRFFNQAFETLLKILKPETAVGSLTRQDFKRVRAILEDLAPNWSKKKDIASLPIIQAAKRCRELGLPRPGLNHINHFIHAYRIMMEFAVAEGAVQTNCVKLLLRRVPIDQLRGTRPFSMADLQRVFSFGPCFEGPLPAEKKNELFWLPLISLWMGLRLSEGAQLATADVEVIDGIPVFRVRPRPNDNPAIAQFVKTEAAIRVVPIHPALQALGLLDHWEWAKARGDGKLFGGTRRKGVSYTYNWISWRCNQWVREALGAKRALTFRSFRHNFRDALRDAEIPADRAFFLGGWTGKTAPDRYGIGGSIPRLYEDIKKVKYPGLDLSHLMTADARLLPAA